MFDNILCFVVYYPALSKFPSYIQTCKDIIKLIGSIRLPVNEKLDGPMVTVPFSLARTQAILL